MPGVSNPGFIPDPEIEVEIVELGQDEPKEIAVKKEVPVSTFEASRAKFVKDTNQNIGQELSEIKIEDVHPEDKNGDFFNVEVEAEDTFDFKVANGNHVSAKMIEEYPQVTDLDSDLPNEGKTLASNEYDQTACVEIGNGDYEIFQIEPEEGIKTDTDIEGVKFVMEKTEDIPNGSASSYTDPKRTPIDSDDVEFVTENTEDIPNGSALSHTVPKQTLTDSDDIKYVTGKTKDVPNGSASIHTAPKRTPTAQVAPTLQGTRNTENCRISITDEHGQDQLLDDIPAPNSVEVTEEDKRNQTEETPIEPSSNARTYLQRVVRGSVKNANQLDVNFLRNQLQLSDRRIKGRRLLYLDSGPYGEEDTKWLEWIETQFKKIAGDDHEISLKEFKDALGVKKSFFAERFFHLFDQDGSGSIELPELMDGLRMVTKGTSAQKLQFLFDVYDADGSGTIDRDELYIVLKSCMEESSLSLSEDDLDLLTDVLFDSADADESGEITFEELRAELEKHPGVIENLTISAAQWLRPPSNENKKEGWARHLTWKYIRNNLRKVIFILWFLAMNIFLYVYGAWRYRDSNGFIIAARGAGMCLNFTCMFILVLMLRKCITFLRQTFFYHILPLDQNIFFHKMVGWTIAWWTVVHTLAHLGNGIMLSQEKDWNLALILFWTKAGIGYVGSSALVTGWLLDLILVIMVVCSMPFVRRSGHFQVFYWTHLLYIPFWILVLLHGPNFWHWFIVPGFMFVLEKIFRSKLVKFARYGNTYIEEVNLLPSGVTHLVISRPANFKYKPGDYLNIQVPCIAKHEWHPFTISSAPEMPGKLWLHVRSAGHWTKKLYEYFEKYQGIDAGANGVNDEKGISFKRKSTKRSVKRKLSKKVSSKSVHIKCYLDGPYGTGCREVFDTEHAVLIGAGIGVTPMASILQSIWYRYKEAKQICPNCQHMWYGRVSQASMKIKKVDFIWINRDQKAFEWFLSLLTQLEVEQGKDLAGRLDNVIQMHMYMTAAQKKTDMKGIGLQMALDLIHNKLQKDLITGLKTRTEPGRPNWNKVFTKIRDEHQGKVHVFFCGSPALGRSIKEECARFHFSFTNEHF